MFEVNRSVLVLRPKQAFVDWLFSLPFSWDTKVVNLAQLQHDCNALLIPPAEHIEDVQKFIRQHWHALLQAELLDWCEDSTLWPEKITQNLFSQWFDITLHSVLTDWDKAPLECVAFSPLDTRLK